MAVRLVTGLSDSYKANQISSMVQSGTRFSEQEVRMMIDSASDSYKSNMLSSCRGSITSIHQHWFLAMLTNMSDTYKTGFARECVYFLKTTITSTTLISCLSGMSDSYKSSFVTVLLPYTEKLSSITLITILNDMSDSYKHTFISMCLPYLHSSLTGNDLNNLLSSCSDSYKADIIRAIGDKLILQSYDDIFSILYGTSDSYCPVLTNLLNSRVKKESISNTINTTGSIVSASISGAAVKTTGAIVSAGGLGVAGAINDAVKTTGAIVSAGRLGVAGAINAGGALKTTGAIVSAGRLGVAGAINAGGAVKNTVRFMADSVENVVACKNIEEQKIADCVICLNAPAEWLIVPCGHKVCCQPCGNILVNCPICRSSKTQLVKVFG